MPKMTLLDGETVVGTISTATRLLGPKTGPDLMVTTYRFIVTAKRGRIPSSAEWSVPISEVTGVSVGKSFGLISDRIAVDFASGARRTFLSGHPRRGADTLKAALAEAPLRASDTKSHEPALPHPAPDDEHVCTPADQVAPSPVTEPRFTLVDASGVTSGPFSPATLAGLRKIGALSANAALVAEDTGSIWSLNDVLREFGGEDSTAGILRASHRTGATQPEVSGADAVDNMPTQSSQRPEAIIMAILVGLGIIWSFSQFLPFSFLAGGDTGKAEHMIEQKYDASDVSCRQLGDVIYAHQWTCTGRWEGTDGVAFWANEDVDDKDMWVGMGSGQ